MARGSAVGRRGPAGRACGSDRRRERRGARRAPGPAGSARRARRASDRGPAQTLAIIDGQPEVRAPDLAAELGRDTASFKRDVRKLKELGLTESLEIGYRLSPAGRALLDGL